MQGLDHDILLYIAQHVRQDWLTPIVTLITSLGNAGAIWLVIAFVLVIRPRTRRCGIAMLLALLLGLLIGNLAIKNIVARPRPFRTYTDIIPLVSPGDLYSFPSGHTLSSFCAATACFGFYKTGNRMRGSCGIDRTFSPLCRRSLSDRRAVRCTVGHCAGLDFGLDCQSDR